MLRWGLRKQGLEGWDGSHFEDVAKLAVPWESFTRTEPSFPVSRIQDASIYTAHSSAAWGKPRMVTCGSQLRVAGPCSLSFQSYSNAFHCAEGPCRSQSRGQGNPGCPSPVQRHRGPEEERLLWSVPSWLFRRCKVQHNNNVSCFPHTGRQLSSLGIGPLALSLQRPPWSVWTRYEWIV